MIILRSCKIKIFRKAQYGVYGNSQGVYRNSKLKFNPFFPTECSSHKGSVDWTIEKLTREIELSR